MNASEETVELGKQVVVVLYQLLENGTAQYAFEVQMRWRDEITAVRNMIRQRTGISQGSIAILFSGKRISGKIALYQLDVRNNRIRLDFYCPSFRNGSNACIQIVSQVHLDAVDSPCGV